MLKPRRFAFRLLYTYLLCPFLSARKRLHRSRRRQMADIIRFFAERFGLTREENSSAGGDACNLWGFDSISDVSDWWSMEQYENHIHCWWRPTFMSDKPFFQSPVLCSRAEHRTSGFVPFRNPAVQAPPKTKALDVAGCRWAFLPFLECHSARAQRKTDQL